MTESLMYQFHRVKLHEKPHQSLQHFYQTNIKEETLKDPMFNMMPILKNIARRNLIPTIDFEEFN